LKEAGSGLLAAPSVSSGYFFSIASHAFALETNSMLPVSGKPARVEFTSLITVSFASSTRNTRTCTSWRT
jgi:hypothetical protein